MFYFCLMRIKAFLFILPVIIGYSSLGQGKWDLRKCVDYALANNISIKQSDIQAKIAALQLKQSKQNIYPTLSFSGGPSFNNGRNQDPTTFSLITESYFAAN